MSDPTMPNVSPDDPTPDETIKIPERVKYGIFIYETTDELAETGIHVHAPPPYDKISVGHLLRLLIGAKGNLEAELIWQKFNYKAQEAKARSKIVLPGSGS